MRVSKADAIGVATLPKERAMGFDSPAVDSLIKNCRTQEALSFSTPTDVYKIYAEEQSDEDKKDTEDMENEKKRAVKPPKPAKKPRRRPTKPAKRKRR